MDRRRFIASVVGVVVAIPLVARAQPAKSHRIGFLANGSPTTPSSQNEAFRRSLRELGWIEGQNVTIEYRWAEGDPDRLPTLLAELVQAKVDVIVLSGPPAMRAAQKATNTIPIVFVLLSDPAVGGYVTSLARPGRNITGTSGQAEDAIGKALQLVSETRPGISRIAYLGYLESAYWKITEDLYPAAAQRLGRRGVLVSTCTAPPRLPQDVFSFHFMR